jgi:hypothetical protein
LRIIKVSGNLLLGCQRRMSGTPPNDAAHYKQQNAQNEYSKSQTLHDY